MENGASFKALLLGTTLAVTGMTSANAAQDLFLVFPGISGGSVIKGHQGQIDLTGFSMNASSSQNFVGSGGGAGKLTCGAVTLTKSVDIASPKFFQAVVTGRVTAGPVTVMFDNTANNRGGALVENYQVDLKQVVVTGVSHSDLKQDVTVTETINLLAGSFTVTYNPGRPNAASFSFDCRADVAL